MSFIISESTFPILYISQYVHDTSLTGPVQTSNFSCVEPNANELKQWTKSSLKLDLAHEKFDVWTGPYLFSEIMIFK
jgi:hypothetical protein